MLHKHYLIIFLLSNSKQITPPPSLLSRAADSALKKMGMYAENPYIMKIDPESYYEDENDDKNKKTFQQELVSR